MKHEQTFERMQDPQPGDHFTEMFAFYALVLQNDKDNFIYMEAHGGDTIPTDGKLIICTYQEFHDRLQYDSAAMKGKYWVDYMGREKQEFVDECLEYFKEDIENFVPPEDEYQAALHECLGVGYGI